MGGYEPLPQEVKELIEGYLASGEYFQCRQWKGFLTAKSNSQQQKQPTSARQQTSFKNRQKFSEYSSVLLLTQVLHTLAS